MATAKGCRLLGGWPSGSTNYIAFRILAANNIPDFRTITDFRKDHPVALSGMFLQVLMLCCPAGLVKLGHVALDGTKVQTLVARISATRARAISAMR